MRLHLARRAPRLSPPNYALAALTSLASRRPHEPSLVSVLKNSHGKANHKEEHRQQRNLCEEGPAEQQHRHQPYQSNPIRNHRDSLPFAVPILTQVYLTAINRLLLTWRPPRLAPRDLPIMAFKLVDDGLCDPADFVVS